MSNVIRWNPLREMAAMQSALDRMMDENWRDARSYYTRNGIELDVHETEDTYTVTAVLPGIHPEHINVRLHDGVLSISGELVQPEPNEGTRVLLQERTYGQFSRTVRLPQPIDENAVEATFENGLLNLTLPKAAEAKPRQIPVRVQNGS
jgi:HSP20 family protein